MKKNIQKLIKNLKENEKKAMKAHKKYYATGAHPAMSPHKREADAFFYCIDALEKILNNSIKT